MTQDSGDALVYVLSTLPQTWVSRAWMGQPDTPMFIGWDLGLEPSFSATLPKPNPKFAITSGGRNSGKTLALKRPPPEVGGLDDLR